MKNTANSMKKSYKIALTTAALLTGLVGGAQAAAVTWTGGGDGSTWSDGANWGGTAPVSGGTDTPTINGAFTVNYDVVAAQNFNDIDVLGGATLNMLTGAFTLNGADNFSTGNVQGGSVINFVGGAHDFSTRLGVANGGSGGTIRVTGNDATITMGQTAAMSGATFDFIFDSDGVSSLDFNSYVQGVTQPQFLTVNGALYTGGSGEFTLINAGVESSGLLAEIDNISVSGFSGYSTLVTQDQVNDRVYLTVKAIPEPSTLALLGTGLGVLMAARRRVSHTNAA